MSAVTAESQYQITGNGYAPEGEVKQSGKPAGKDSVVGLLGRVSMLCNDAELFQEGVWKVEGDPTEGALYPFATKSEWTGKPSRPPIPGSTPFRSNRSIASWRPYTRTPVAKRRLVKGAPE